MVTPVLFVLRAKKNHRSCVEGGSRGEEEVELSLSDLQFFFFLERVKRDVGRPGRRLLQ